MAPGQELNIDVLHDVAFGDIDIDLFDPNGNLVASGATGTSNETVVYGNYGSTTQVVTLRVFLWAFLPPAAEPCAFYDVALARGPLTPCVDDSFEDNDTALTAAPLTTNLTGLVVNPSDRDFFSVHLESGDAVDVVAVLATAISGLQVTLYDPAGNALDADSFSPLYDVSGLNTTGVAGDFIVEVVGDDCLDYDLGFLVTPAPTCVDDAYEDNDTAGNATPVAAGTYP
ncbi:MAG: hypothetical protein H6734_21690 [Alphaproteobacteria bacterium]|nr:hypothetical protein [Alphaproteobacteria bacterium]